MNGGHLYGNTLYFRVHGIEQVRAAFRKFRERAEKKMRTLTSETATEIRRAARANAPVGATGELRRAIRKSTLRKGAWSRVAQTIRYASFQELGTRFIEEKRYLRDEVHSRRSRFHAQARRILRDEGVIGR